MRAGNVEEGGGFHPFVSPGMSARRLVWVCCGRLSHRPGRVLDESQGQASPLRSALESFPPTGLDRILRFLDKSPRSPIGAKLHRAAVWTNIQGFG